MQHLLTKEKFAFGSLLILSLILMVENCFDLKGSRYNITMNSKVTCDCGTMVNRVYYQRHLKTKKHAKRTTARLRCLLMDVAVPDISEFCDEVAKGIARHRKYEKPTECCVCLSAVADQPLQCVHMLCSDCFLKMNRCPLCRVWYDNPEYDGDVTYEDVTEEQIDATNTESAIWSNETVSIETDAIDEAAGIQSYVVKWRFSVDEDTRIDHMYRVLGRLDDHQITWGEYFENRTVIHGVRCDLQAIRQFVIETDIGDLTPVWSNPFVRIFKDRQANGERRRGFMVMWGMNTRQHVRLVQLNELKDLLKENNIEIGMVANTFCIRGIIQTLTPLVNLVERAISNS